MKIVIIGNYGAKNIGDEMILTGLLQSLKNVVPNAEITVLSADPRATSEKYGVLSLPKFPAGLRSFIKYIFEPKINKKALKSADYVILGGGGLFASVNPRANLIWGLQAKKASKFKKPIIMYGQSLGEIKNRFLKNHLQKIFQKSSFIAVRDEESRQQLKNIGVTKKIHLIPDLAFKINPPQNIQRKPHKIIVSLRAMKNFPTQLRDELTCFFKWLIEEKKCQLKFIDYGIGEGDTVLHQAITNKLNHKIEHLSESQINILLEEFASAEFVIGMRLHSIITAIITNTPLIAINYSPKVRNLLRTLKLEDHCLDMNCNLQTLQALYEKTIMQKEEISKKLKKINCDLKIKHQEIERTLASLLV